MKKQKTKIDYGEYILFGIIFLVMLSLLFLPYSFYKADKELSKLNGERLELQKKIILSEEIDTCDKFYLLSLSSWNIQEMNYWLNRQTNCILLKNEKA